MINTLIDAPKIDNLIRQVHNGFTRSGCTHIELDPNEKEYAWYELLEAIKKTPKISFQMIEKDTLVIGMGTVKILTVSEVVDFYVGFEEEMESHILDELYYTDKLPSFLVSPSASRKEKIKHLPFSYNGNILDLMTLLVPELKDVKR